MILVIELISLLILSIILVNITPYKRRYIGECFVICHYLFRGKYIHQRQEKIKGNTCFERLKNFVRQADYLEKELPVGTYHLTTHKTIVRRIERQSNIIIKNKKALHRAFLFSNLSALQGCKDCHHFNRCRYLNDKGAVEFYKIKIYKKER